MLIEESDAEFDVSVQILKFLWSRKWQPTPVFLTGKSHGQKNLAGYSSWGCKESDVIEPWLGLPWTFSTLWSTIQMSDYVSHCFILFTILCHAAYTTIYYLEDLNFQYFAYNLIQYSTHLSVHDVCALGMHTDACISVTFSILCLNIVRKDRSSLVLYSNDHF